jgi:hypothetical protein
MLIIIRFLNYFNSIIFYYLQFKKSQSLSLLCFIKLYKEPLTNRLHGSLLYYGNICDDLMYAVQNLTLFLVVLKANKFYLVKLFYKYEKPAANLNFGNGHNLYVNFLLTRNFLTHLNIKCTLSRLVCRPYQRDSVQNLLLMLKSKKKRLVKHDGDDRSKMSKIRQQRSYKIREIS